MEEEFTKVADNKVLQLYLPLVLTVSQKQTVYQDHKISPKYHRPTCVKFSAKFVILFALDVATNFLPMPHML